MCETTVQNFSLGVYMVFSELVKSEDWNRSRWDTESVKSVIGVPWSMTEGRHVSESSPDRIREHVQRRHQLGKSEGAR